MPSRASAGEIGACPQSTAWARRRAAQRREVRRLRLCAVCGGDCLASVESQHADRWSTRLLLRCGECQTWCDVTVSRVAKGIRRAFDRRGAELARLAARLERERMLDEAHAMSVALRRDLIDASDFGPRVD